MHANYLCSGQGEDALLAFLTALENGEDDFQKIHGISYKDADKVHFSSKAGFNTGNPENYPVNYYDWKHFFLQDESGIHNFTIEDYKKYSKHNGDSYSLMTSISCPYNCSYCINSFLHKLYGSEKKFRRRPVANVIEEIKNACHDIPSVNFINFLDDHFLSDPQWIEEFIAEYSAIKKPFIIRAAPKSFDANLLNRLKEIGLEVIQIGIQSGSPKTHQQIFHRFFSEYDLLASSYMLADAGIKAIYDIIIDNEFEDDTDRMQTLELILKLRHPYELSLFSLTPFPGTDLINLYKEKGIKPQINPYYSDYTHHNASNFFYRFAKLIPHIDHDFATQLFNALQEEETKQKIDALFSCQNLT